MVMIHLLYFLDGHKTMVLPYNLQGPSRPHEEDSGFWSSIESNVGWAA